MAAFRKKSSYEKQQEKFQKSFDKQMKKIIPDAGEPTLMKKYKIEGKPETKAEKKKKKK